MPLSHTLDMLSADEAGVMLWAGWLCADMVLAHFHGTNCGPCPSQLYVLGGANKPCAAAADRCQARRGLMQAGRRLTIEAQVENCVVRDGVRLACVRLPGVAGR